MSGKRQNDHVKAARELGTGYWTKDVSNPAGPVGRLKLYELLHHDSRAKYRHHKVWQFHLGYSHKDHGNTSLASFRTIRDVLQARSPVGTPPLSMKSIHAATLDLIEWGYLSVISKGGRGATRYLVAWNLLNIAARGEFSVHLSGEHREVPHLPPPPGEAGENEFSVQPRGEQCVTPRVNTKSDSVHPLGNKDPATDTGLIDPVICSGNVSPPPSADGLAATARGVEFKRALAAYDNDNDNENEARAAWDAIGPDSKLAAHIRERAASWKRTAKPDTPRLSFANWLRKKKYEKPDRKPVAANDNAPAVTTGKKTTAPAPPPPVVESHVEIVEAEVSDDLILRLAMRTDAGDLLSDEIVLQADDEATQRAGQKRFGALQAAVDLPTVEDPRVLVGCHLLLVRAPYRPEYGYKPAAMARSAA